jgi:hypothetical protein
VHTKIRILVEDDDYLRIVPTIIDPDVPDERRKAIADFVYHDVPDFDGWCHGLRQTIPNLIPPRSNLPSIKTISGPNCRSPMP